MKKLDLTIQNISKMEGHADIVVKVRDDEVKNVHIRFTENKRFFTQAMEGQNISNLPQSTARICGTCSTAHILCAIEAIERSLKIKSSEQTMLLRKLTNYGLMIRDHALHLYLFSMPDVFNKDSVLEFSGTETKFLNDCFDVKRAGNRLSTLVASRAVHPQYPVVGGFSQIPENTELKKILPELEAVREKIFPLMDVYYNSKIDYTRKTNFVALVNNEFNFLDGDIKSSHGLHIKEEKYSEHLKQTVLPYSTAVGYKFEGDTYMVGALARINLSKDNLHKNTQKDAKRYLSVFPSNNIFHNNLAQAIEILHSIDHSIEIIKSSNFKKEAPIKFQTKECEGTGVIEAPRGILYYHLNIDKAGNIKNGRIITPTQQNQINIELDIKNLVQKNLKTLSKEQIQYEMEKLIRAYDPCISCSTHFLKVHWT